MKHWKIFKVKVKKYLKKDLILKTQFMANKLCKCQFDIMNEGVKGLCKYNLNHKKLLYKVYVFSLLHKQK